MRRGRCKIEIKRIEDLNKSQSTFSKRKTGLAKKAREVSVLCDTDIAFVAFSPSSRSVHHFSHKRFEDVLLRYINQPINKRNYKIKNVEEKLKKLQHIELEEERVAFVKKQVDDLREQIRKFRTETADLDSEASNFGQGLKINSLGEALWREKDLEVSLKYIREKKLEMISTNPISYSQPSFTEPMEMNTNGLMQPSFGFGTEGVNSGHRFIKNQLLMQMDPWLKSKIQRSRTGLGMVTENHAIDIPVFNNPSTPNVGPMLQNQQQMVGNIAPIVVSNQEMPIYGSPFMDSLNLQEGVPPMFNPEVMNLSPNAPITYRQNLNAPGTSNPPRVPSSTLYDPSYEQMGLQVDPFLRLLNNRMMKDPPQNQERALGQSEMPVEDIQAMVNSMFVNQ